MQAIIGRMFPDLPKIQPVKLPVLQPGQQPISLAQLQEIAIINNPLLVQADADITTAFGAAVKAGTHPNPIIGYEADTIGSARTRDYEGIAATQLVKTANKLGLARAVANYDVMNAQLNVGKARVDLTAKIKTLYFSVLVAQENLIISEALVRFSNELYRVHVDKLKAGEATAYEPVQLRAIVVQDRAALVAAENRYVSAWKQLAAALAAPSMPPTVLEGHVDMPLPAIQYQDALARIFSSHPDVLAARNVRARERTQMQLERVTPIPDVSVYGTFQKDLTTPGLAAMSYNLLIGVPVPIFDRNRGGIIGQEGDIRRADVQLQVVQNNLAASLADAFERFETGRTQSQYYRDQVLPDLARAYRGVYERHQQEPGVVGFSDVIVAWYNLANGISSYIAALNNQFAALADLANLLQVEDLNQLYQGSFIPLPVPNPSEPVPPPPVEGGKP